jgi:hypothetical protein
VLVLLHGIPALSWLVIAVIMVLRRPAQIAFEAKVGGLIAPDHKTELRAEILRVLAGDDQPETAVD